MDEMRRRMTAYGSSRRYRFEGDKKPSMFVVGDLFTFPNGETALVTEVFDFREGKSKYGPEWALRFFWTAGPDGAQYYKGQWDNPFHGASRTNMFNQLSIRGKRHLIPAP